jgi:valyl-tRNA synthetase
MPFITEELWQRLPRPRPRKGKVAPDSIMMAPYPKASRRQRDPQAEERMAIVMEAVTGIRTIRGEMRISPAQTIAVTVKPDGASREVFAETASIVESLARARVTIDPAAVRTAQSALVVVGHTEIYVDLAGVVDLAAERARLGKEIARADEAIRFVEAKLERPEFVQKAPAAVVGKERERLEEQRRLRAKLEASLAWIAEGSR